MKSSILADTEKMVHPVTYYLIDEEGNGYSVDQAREIVEEVQQFIENDPGLDYNSPLFSFSAYAHTAVGFWDNPYVGNVPDCILMGEGLLEYLSAAGHANHGPDVILGHEFGHQIQFEMELFPLFLDPAPEASRKRELMADAYSGYFLAHNKGANFGKQRIAEAMEASADFGDCSFKNQFHHGTPNQREKAVQFGATLANQKYNGKKNAIMPAAEFMAAFEASYDELIAPDANTTGLLR